MIDLRLPSITGNDKEQLVQIRSYLYQLVSQLQHALSTMGTSEAQAVTPTPKSLQMGAGGTSGSISPQSTFNSIKALIIKSADIVEAYYDEINKKLEGIYVAQSDFGDYAEKTSQEIEENSTSTTQRFENIQVIIADHDSNISSMDESLKSIGEDLSYAQNNIATINSNIESLDNSIASVEGDVGALDEELKSTKEEFSGTINSTKEELSSSVADTESRLSNNISDAKTEMLDVIDGSIVAAKDYTDNATNEISGKIDSTKDELEGSIDSTKNELEEKVNGVSSDLQEAKNSTNDRISSIYSDLQNTKEDINNSLQEVHTSVGGVNALLEDAKSQLQGSLDDLEVYVTGLKEVIIGVSAYLKSGLLYYTDGGIPVYGLEIGQTVTDEVSGEEAFNKYARFTSEKLSFFDSNSIEVAYISDKKLYIRMAQITISFQIGGLIDLVMSNGDVVTKWVGTGG